MSIRGPYNLTEEDQAEAKMLKFRNRVLRCLIVIQEESFKPDNQAAKQWASSFLNGTYEAIKVADLQHKENKKERT